MIHHVILLAGGNGTRMLGSVPKLLKEIAGKSIIENALDRIPPSIKVVVVCAPEIQSYLSTLEFTEKREVLSVIQDKEKRGTGIATKNGLDALESAKDGDIVAILYGDTPLFPFDNAIKAGEKIAEEHCEACIFGFRSKGLNSYGKISLNDNGEVEKIIESSEGGNEITDMHCNAGILVSRIDLLKDFLSNMTPNHKTNEFYLTDIVEFGKFKNKKIGMIEVEEAFALGVNSLSDLSNIECVMKKQICKNLLLNGVFVHDVEHTYPMFDTRIGKGSIVEPGVMFLRNVTIGENCHIQAHSRFENCTIGNNCRVEHSAVINNSTIDDNCTIKAFSYIDGLRAKQNVSVGPFARIRPNTTLLEEVGIGNFVEIKESTIGRKTKAGHLSYIGNAMVGEEVNFGAGAITCNYDGFLKHQTHIGSNVFIGANAILIAPIKIDNGSIIAASARINKDVHENDIVVMDGKAKYIANGAHRYREIKKKAK